MSSRTLSIFSLTPTILPVEECKEEKIKIIKSGQILPYSHYPQVRFQHFVIEKQFKSFSTQSGIKPTGT